jgi:hypothetical protein
MQLRVSRGWYTAVSPAIYYLFDRNPTPYSHLTVNLRNAPPIAWEYDLDTYKLFHHPRRSIQPRAQHLPFLSLSIRQGQEEYDLSEFMQEIHIYHPDKRYPSIGQLVGLWTLHSGVVLNLAGHLELSIITDMGDSIEKAFHPSDSVEQVLQTEETAT